MIKDNQKTLNRLHIVLDAVIIVLAYLVAYQVRFKILPQYIPSVLLDGVGHLTWTDSAVYLTLLIPGDLFLYSVCDLYKPRRGKRKKIDVWNLIKANILGALFFTFVLFVYKQPNLSRIFFFIFAAFNFGFGVLFRYILYKILRSLRKWGFNQKHVLILGYSRAAEAYIDRLMGNPEWGYHVHGILDDNMEVETAYKKIKVIGTIKELAERLQDNKLDEIVITLNIKEYSKLEGVVFICEKSGVHTKFVPDYNNIIASNPYMEDLFGLPVINIRNVPLSNTFSKMMKRLVDLFFGIIALILFSIPMLLVALLVRITSKGPIIFSQNRVGLHNREFKMYKFRSMKVQEAKKEERAWTTSNDSRVTNVGKFIRKTSLDELPQIINVIKGDMSLVGPRPERPLFVEKFREEIPRYMIKHQVRPGITGWAQINGYRGDTSIIKRIEYDLYYIENWSMMLDFKILFLTVFKGFINRNAY